MRGHTKTFERVPKLTTVFSGMREKCPRALLPWHSPQPRYDLSHVEKIQSLVNKLHQSTEQPPCTNDIENFLKIS